MNSYHYYTAILKFALNGDMKEKLPPGHRVIDTWQIENKPMHVFLGALVEVAYTPK
jgi:hypothetical protein